MGIFDGKYLHKKIDITQHDANRPFKTGYIEHTQMDVFLVCPINNQVMGRPWLTILVDEYSRRLLATYVSLEAPSYKSLEKIIQECIKKHSSLPNTIILESGDEAYGKELDDLIYKYNLTFKFIPKINLGYKSSIERLFMSIDLNYQLKANTFKKQEY